MFRALSHHQINNLDSKKTAENVTQLSPRWLCYSWVSAKIEPIISFSSKLNLIKQALLENQSLFI